MIRTYLVAGLLVVLTGVPAQTVPPMCFGFNQTGSHDNVMVFGNFCPLTILFTAPQSVTVNQLVMYESTIANASVSAAIHPINPATGLPTSPALATAPPVPWFIGFGWTPRSFTAPLALVAGTQYALVCSAVQTMTPCGFLACQATIYYDTFSATSLLPYLPPGGCGFPAGPLGFKFGFQGPACGPLLAEIRSGGPPCGGGSLWQPLLAGSERPALGQGHWYSVYVGPGVTPGIPVGLFWSFGSNPAGIPLFTGSPCFHYLNPVSFAALAAAGLEPLVTVPVQPGLNPVAFFISVPAMPALIGTPIGVQAVLVDPAGVPSGIPGVNVRLSNSLTLVLGL